MSWFYEECGLNRKKILELSRKAAAEGMNRICARPEKVLLLPPDITRAHCGAGWITENLYHFFSEFADVHLIPTLGQHVPHTPEENQWMFGSVPEEKIHAHDWRDGSKVIGEVPAGFVKEISRGKADWAIPVSLNKMLLEQKWDLIINIGHVVPHEVLGFANHNKNYFIGLGGKDMICASHMMAACCGIENNLGQLITPLRACYNKAEKDFLGNLPDMYIQLVMAYDDHGKLEHTGFYVGDDLDTYLQAAQASLKQNVTVVPPLKKVVAVMQGDEFHSAWVANKAVYRTRMAMADEGELLIIAPGLKRFGEQPEVDKLIRKYGYVGTEKVMELWRKEPILQDLTHGTAHLIHSSSEGRFKITYAPGHLTREEVEGVNFNYADYKETIKRYDPAKLKTGFNTLPDGEEIYFISTPSAGLWSTEEKLFNRDCS
ncbi:lactate racemase domain-containing protein [Lentisphaerota bacterium ZTH]|nr:DUF2088 domain-containing protein [Lentisphaerota bacterium]WET06171.1 lactate racemase domain-containing protein [Lentisphaerota bacterium ZTH]